MIPAGVLSFEVGGGVAANGNDLVALLTGIGESGLDQLGGDAPAAKLLRDDDPLNDQLAMVDHLVFEDATGVVPKFSGGWIVVEV